MPQKQKYRLFTWNGRTSCYDHIGDTYTGDPGGRVRMIRHYTKASTIAVPHDRKDLWPDPKTGQTTPELWKYLNEHTELASLVSIAES